MRVDDEWDTSFSPERIEAIERQVDEEHWQKTQAAQQRRERQDQLLQTDLPPKLTPKQQRKRVKMAAKRYEKKKRVTMAKAGINPPVLSPDQTSLYSAAREKAIIHLKFRKISFRGTSPKELCHWLHLYTPDCRSDYSYQLALIKWSETVPADLRGGEAQKRSSGGSRSRMALTLPTPASSQATPVPRPTLSIKRIAPAPQKTKKRFGAEEYRAVASAKTQN